MIQGDGWSSSSTNSASMGMNCEVVVYVDPPSKQLQRIRVNMRSVAIDDLLTMVLRNRQKAAAGKPGAKKPKWTCRLDFDLRRHGRATATELDDEARAALRMPKKSTK